MPITRILPSGIDSSLNFAVNQLVANTVLANNVDVLAFANAAFNRANTSGAGGLIYKASSTRPLTANIGDQWYSTTEDILYEYLSDGTSNVWVDITSPLPTNYGIVYKSSASAPATANVGDQWYSTTEDILYEYLSDGTSSFWVDISSSKVSGNVTVVSNMAGMVYKVSATRPVTANVGDQWYSTTEDVLYEYLTDGTANAWVDIYTAKTSYGNVPLLVNNFQSQNVTFTNNATSINFTGAGVTASNTGNTVVVNIPNGPGPLFSVYASGGQSLPSGQTTNISLQNKLYDTAVCFNNTGSTVTLNGISVPAYAFAPNIPGYYQFNYSVRQAGATSEIVAIVNKSNVAYTATASDSLSNVVGSTGSSLVYMNGISDYMILQAYVGATGTVQSRNNTANSVTYGYDTFFQGFLIQRG
jgi:hypothetical protein